MVGVVQSLDKDEDALTLTEEQIAFHHKALQQRITKKEKKKGKSLALVPPCGVLD